MLHHVSLPVADLDASKQLYDAILNPLGYRCVFQYATAVGYGLEDGKDKLCLKLTPRAQSAGPGFHLAFAAPSNLAVDAFHADGMLAGATNNGDPGLRPDYSPTYYAAFLIDLDGHRLEAVNNSSDD